MNIPIERGDPHRERIAVICHLLEEEVAQNPDIARTNVSHMYLLAAQYIRNAHAKKASPMSREELLLFQLSGFKKPLAELIAQAKLDNTNKEKYEALMNLRQYFLSRYNELLQQSFIHRR